MQLKQPAFFRNSGCFCSCLFRWTFFHIWFSNSKLRDLKKNTKKGWQVSQPTTTTLFQEIKWNRFWWKKKKKGKNGCLSRDKRAISEGWDRASWLGKRCQVHFHFPVEKHKMAFQNEFLRMERDRTRFVWWNFLRLSACEIV